MSVSGEYVRACLVCGGKTYSKLNLCQKNPDCSRAYTLAKKADDRADDQGFNPIDDDSPMARDFRTRIMALHGISGVYPRTANGMFEVMGEHAQYGGEPGCWACERANIGHVKGLQHA